MAQCRACGEIFPPTSRLGVLFLSGGVAPFPRAGRRSSSLSFALLPGGASSARALAPAITFRTSSSLRCMPLRSWPSLVFAFAVLFIVVVFPNHYPFKAPISSPWASNCAQTVVLVRRGLDFVESRSIAKDLHQVGQAPFLRSQAPHPNQSCDGAPTL